MSDHQILLEEIPSTGYLWSVLVHDPTLEVVANGYIDTFEDPDDEIAGAAMTRKIIVKGTGCIILTLRRSWNINSVIAHATYTFNSEKQVNDHSFS